MGSASVFYFDDIGTHVEDMQSLWEEALVDHNQVMSKFNTELMKVLQMLFDKPSAPAPAAVRVCKSMLRKCRNCAGAWFAATVFTCVMNGGELHWNSHRHLTPLLIPPGYKQVDGKALVRDVVPAGFDIMLPFRCDHMLLRQFADRYPRVNYDTRLLVTTYPCAGNYYDGFDFNENGIHAELVRRTGLAPDNVLVFEGEGDFSYEEAMTLLLMHVRDNSIAVAVDLDSEIRAGFFMNAQAFVRRGVSAYIPMVWSTYDPKNVEYARTFRYGDRLDHYYRQIAIFSDDGGMWRSFGASVHAISGADAKLFATDPSFRAALAQARDTQSMQEYVQKHRHVIRMREPDVIQQWHPRECNIDSASTVIETTPCLGSKAVLSGSQLELFLRLHGRNTDEDRIRSAHTKKQASIKSIRENLDGLVDQLADPGANAELPSVKQNIESLIRLLRDQRQILPHGLKEDMGQGRGNAGRAKEAIDVIRDDGKEDSAGSAAPHWGVQDMGSKSLLVFVSRVADLPETLARAAFYRSCGFSTLVVFSARECAAQDAAACHAGERYPGLMMTSIDAPETDPSIFHLAAFSWLGGQQGLLEAYNNVVLVNPNTVLNPVKIIDWLAMVTDTESIYSGLAERRTGERDEFCAGVVPMVLSTKKLLLPMGSRGWDVCRDLLMGELGKARGSYDQEIGHCVIKHLNVGCNEGMAILDRQQVEGRLYSGDHIPKPAEFSNYAAAYGPLANATKYWALFDAHSLGLVCTAGEMEKHIIRVASNSSATQSDSRSFPLELTPKQNTAMPAAAGLNTPVAVKAPKGQGEEGTLLSTTDVMLTSLLNLVAKDSSKVWP